MHPHGNWRKWLAAGALSALVPSLAAAACEWQSPPHRLGLLELYTSEGCNSCPPADQWLTRMRSAPPQDKFIALAFHVDYWNQLGWPDRFSSARHTRRQQEAAERNRAGFVYTPQFLLDGKDIRPLGAPDLLKSRLAPINDAPAQAEISARATLDEKGSIHLQGRSRAAQPAVLAETFIALYEHGLMSNVARGENAGRTLRHDYVVREWLGPLRADAAGAVSIDQRIALPPDARLEHIGLAIVTQERGSGKVLQAGAIEGCLSR